MLMRTTRELLLEAIEWIQAERDNVHDSNVEAGELHDRDAIDTIAKYDAWLTDARAGTTPVPCSDRMPPEHEYVLMWETPSLHWSVGCWFPEYQQWGNRDDREYPIHANQVSHWMPLPDAISR